MASVPGCLFLSQHHVHRRVESLNDYIPRINRVIDYIKHNIDQKLTLDRLADIASFSKYHFHRIFHAMCGEPLFQFIQRVRLEKAAFFLSARPDMSITDIALTCGFSGSSSFSKSFHSYFDCSPSSWRRAGNMVPQPTKQNNMGNLMRNSGKDGQYGFP